MFSYSVLSSISRESRSRPFALRQDHFLCNHRTTWVSLTLLILSGVEIIRCSTACFGSQKLLRYPPPRNNTTKMITLLTRVVSALHAVLKYSYYRTDFFSRASLGRVLEGKHEKIVRGSWTLRHEVSKANKKAQTSLSCPKGKNAEDWPCWTCNAYCILPQRYTLNGVPRLQYGHQTRKEG